MEHCKGEKITFVAQRKAKLAGKEYKKGDEVELTLIRDWNDEDGTGAGGPWGWGGYTARLLKSIGEIL